jgi:hypothetical protein
VPVKCFRSSSPQYNGVSYSSGITLFWCVCVCVCVCVFVCLLCVCVV